MKITERTAHSLYISRYQLGRDATVNYPDVDLKFENDTKKWLVVRGQSGGDGDHDQPPRRADRAPRRERDRRAQGHGAAGDRDAFPTRRCSRARRSWRTPASLRAAVAVKRIVYVNGEGPLQRDLVHELQVRAEDRPRGHDPGARGGASSAARPHPTPPPSPPPASTQTGPSQTTPTTTTAPSRLRPGDRLDEPGRDAHRAKRARVDRRVGRPALGDGAGGLARALDDVLEAEARAVHVRDPRVEPQPVVEAARATR